MFKANTCLFKLLFYIGVAILSIDSSYAQTRQPELDIDKVYQLYKDTNAITIHTGGKEIKANILISYNALNKPYSIIAYGEADANATEALNKLKIDLGLAKLQAGYKQAPGEYPVSFNPAGNYENSINVTLFQKGTQSAKYGIKKIMYRDQTAPGTFVERHVSDFFYFEVCDEGRRNASKPEEKFVF